MEIRRIYPKDASKKTMYDLTCSPKVQKLSLCDGQILDIKAWCSYVDADVKTGEARELLAIQTPEGEVYATNSPTTLRDFFRMVDMFGDDGVTAVEVVSAKSKNGRTFYTVVYAGD